MFAQYRHVHWDTFISLEYICLVKNILHNQITELVSLGTVLADSLITLVYCPRLVSLSCFGLIVLLNYTSKEGNIYPANLGLGML